MSSLKNAVVKKQQLFPGLNKKPTASVAVGQSALLPATHAGGGLLVGSSKARLISARGHAGHKVNCSALMTKRAKHLGVLIPPGAESFQCEIECSDDFLSVYTGITSVGFHPVEVDSP